VHKNDRIALAFVEIDNFDSAVAKTRHHQFHVLGIGMDDLAMTASLALRYSARQSRAGRQACRLLS
jgi:hypothetical protein